MGGDAVLRLRDGPLEAKRNRVRKMDLHEATSIYEDTIANPLDEERNIQQLRAGLRNIRYQTEPSGQGAFTRGAKGFGWFVKGLPHRTEQLEGQQHIELNRFAINHAMNTNQRLDDLTRAVNSLQGERDMDPNFREKMVKHVCRN